ncbi:MAG: putrescine ABC transporter permease PotI, partial [Gammaproteobacteria bacterium]
MNRQRSTFLISVLCFGYAFLYIPIIMVMIYSFNDSRIVSVWGGFSFRWYLALLDNRQIIEAALLSLRIALISATIATVMGTLAGLALTRMGRFRGRILFTGMIAAPLVMP